MRTRPRYVHLLGALLLAAGCGDDVDPPSPPADAGPGIDVPAFDGGPEFDAGPSEGAPIRVDVQIEAAAFDQFYADPQNRMYEPTVSVEFDGEMYEDVQMEVHGGFARTRPKLSFRLRFDSDQMLTTQAFNADGPAEEHRRVVLQASWVDPTYARNCLTFDMIRAEGGMAPRCNHAELYVNGEYHGFYALIERIDRTFLERNGLDPDGLLLKAENHSANWADKPNPLDGMIPKGNEEADATPYEELLVALSGTPTDFASFEAAVASRLDLNDWMLWQGVHTLADNRDTFTKNYYLYFDNAQPESQFRIISWDADATWGINWDAMVVEPTTMEIHGHDPFAPRILSIPEYRTPYLMAYGQRVADETSGLTNILAQLDAQRARIGPFVERDLTAWERGISEADTYAALRAAVETRFEVMRGVIAAER